MIGIENFLKNSFFDELYVIVDYFFWSSVYLYSLWKDRKF